MGTEIRFLLFEGWGLKTRLPTTSIENAIIFSVGFSLFGRKGRIELKGRGGGLQGYGIMRGM